MHKSVKCIQQEHASCDGDIIEIIDDSKMTRICECECHSSMYKLVSRMQAAINQRQALSIQFTKPSLRPDIRSSLLLNSKARDSCFNFNRTLFAYTKIFCRSISAVHFHPGILQPRCKFISDNPYNQSIRYRKAWINDSTTW